MSQEATGAMPGVALTAVLSTDNNGSSGPSAARLCWADAEPVVWEWYSMASASMASVRRLKTSWQCFVTFHRSEIPTNTFEHALESCTISIMVGSL